MFPYHTPHNFQFALARGWILVGGSHVCDQISCDHLCINMYLTRLLTPLIELFYISKNNLMKSDRSNKCIDFFISNLYEPAGHIITGNLKIISDSRIRSIISKGPKYRLPSQIDFNKCREEIAVALNEFCKRWCRREHVECNALNSWKISIFNIIEKRISFYSKNLNLLQPKPKLSFRHLKQGIQHFHEKFALATADKASNNANVV